MREAAGGREWRVMNHPLIQLLFRWTVLALGVALGARIIPGVHCDSLGTLLVVVVLLSFFNAVLKPLLVLFTLPFIVFTLGFGILLINAFLFMFVGRLVDGFQVDGFWPALGGALIVSATNMLLSRAVKKKGGPPGPPPGRGGPPQSGGGDVIDI